MKYHQHQDVDKGQGRIETRRCTVSGDIQWLRDRHPHWNSIKTLVEIESKREIQGSESVEKRYYMSSVAPDPEKILAATREHWGIENKLHWVLDVCFGDDHSRIRKGHAPRNLAIIKKTALNLLQIIRKSRPRASLKRMRKLAGWDHNFMDSVLTARF